MNTLLIAGLIFVITLGLSVGAIYLFFEIPARKDAAKRRLEALKETSPTSKSNDAGTAIFQENALSEVTFIRQFLLQLPVSVKLHLFLQQAAVNLTPGRLVLFCVLLDLSPA